MFETEKYPAHGGIVDDGSGSYTEKHGGHIRPVEELSGEDSKYGSTQRKLKSRHIQLIALGKMLRSVISLYSTGSFGEYGC